MPASSVESAVPFHASYLRLVDGIERRFAVARWRAGDVDIWPLARMDLYLDMYWANVGGTLATPTSLLRRVAGRFAAPLLNLWRCRHDLAHWVARPRPADALFLGDGVSLDYSNGEWHDRYADPLIAVLESQERSTLLMQPGDMTRLPWHRPTFAANIVAARGLRTRFATILPTTMPDHEQVVRWLASEGVQAPSLSWNALVKRARTIAAIASAFEGMLQVVRPRLAFVVTYYADLGPAFVLACRRQGVLSIDLQHCPQEGAHKAYGWTGVPERGYSTLPAVFWSWTPEDAHNIQRWSSKLPQPWHRSVHGGHVQLRAFLDDTHPATREWDSRVESLARTGPFEREILITLQPVGGYRAQWDALARQIEASPPDWRWWIRRHPAARAYQDAEYARLVMLRLPNVMIDEASAVPLPALLRRMSVVISRFSGSAVEAAMLGVPALFLSEEARGQFGDLIDRGQAAIVDVGSLRTSIARLPAVATGRSFTHIPPLDSTLLHLEQFAQDYSALCRDALPLNAAAEVSP